MIVLDYLSLAIGAVGVFIVVWGILRTTVSWLALEVRCLRSASCQRRESIRHKLGSYLLLGLEFLIAADIVQTIRNPTLEEVAVLGSIVIIRTVISFFLDREMAETAE